MGILIAGEVALSIGGGGFGPMGNPEGFAPGPVGEGELPVVRGTGIDHDLTTGGFFYTRDPLGADVVEVVFAWVQPRSHVFCVSSGRPVSSSLCRL